MSGYPAGAEHDRSAPFNGHQVMCHYCDGTGQIFLEHSQKDCDICEGTGYVPEHTPEREYEPDEQ